MKRKLICAIISFIMMFSIVGCSVNNGSSEDTGNAEGSSEATVSADKLDITNMFSDRDKEIGYDESSATKIALSDSSVTIDKEGTYILSGTLSNGQVTIDADSSEKIQIILDNVNINCDTSAAIYVKQADKVFVTLAKDSENILSNKSEFVAIDDNNIDSVIFSKDDITFNGLGSLTINAAYGHGIVSKDDAIFTSGTYNITSKEHGISGKDSVRVADGTYNLTSGKDGIHSENTDDESKGFVYIANGKFNLKCETDGIDASSILQVDGGEFKAMTGGGSENASTKSDGTVNKDWGSWGGKPQKNDMNSNMTPPQGRDIPQKNDKPEDNTASGQKPAADQQSSDNSQSASSSETNAASAKGLKSDGNLIISGGSFNINSSDDGIHSNGNVIINEGNIIISSGDDGIHADSKTVINNGTITIEKSYEGIEGKSIDITGGIINLISSDDGLNAGGGTDQSSTGGRPGQNTFSENSSCYIKITGGKINVKVSGDGIDSNGSLTVAGGEIYITGPQNSGNGALDYDSKAEISGGTVIATGMSGMAQNFGASSTQGSMLLTSKSVQQSGTDITVKDITGNVILTYKAQDQYNSVVISSPDIKKGEKYTVTIGTETQTIDMTSITYGTEGMTGGNGGKRKQ